MALKEFDKLRIVQLLYLPEHYLGLKVTKRPPEIGEIGVIVDVQNAPNLPTNYVVEASSPDGTPELLCDFVAEELELVE